MSQPKALVIAQDILDYNGFLAQIKKYKPSQGSEVLLEYLKSSENLKSLISLDKKRTMDLIISRSLFLLPDPAETIVLIPKKSSNFFKINKKSKKSHSQTGLRKNLITSQPVEKEIDTLLCEEIPLKAKCKNSFLNIQENDLNHFPDSSNPVEQKALFTHRDTKSYLSPQRCVSTAIKRRENTSKRNLSSIANRDRHQNSQPFEIKTPIAYVNMTKERETLKKFKSSRNSFFEKKKISSRNPSQADNSSAELLPTSKYSLSSLPVRTKAVHSYKSRPKSILKRRCSILTDRDQDNQYYPLKTNNRGLKPQVRKFSPKKNAHISFDLSNSLNESSDKKIKNLNRSLSSQMTLEVTSSQKTADKKRASKASHLLSPNIFKVEAKSPLKQSQNRLRGFQSGKSPSLQGISNFSGYSRQASNKKPEFVVGKKILSSEDRQSGSKLSKSQEESNLSSLKDSSQFVSSVLFGSVNTNTHLQGTKKAPVVFSSPKELPSKSFAARLEKFDLKEPLARSSIFGDDLGLDRVERGILKDSRKNVSHSDMQASEADGSRLLDPAVLWERPSLTSQ